MHYKQMFFALIGISTLVLIAMPYAVHAAVFNIASGDTDGLRVAIHIANGNGETDVINLSPGIYEVTNVQDSDPLWGDTGLPPIAQGTKLTINGSIDKNGDYTVGIHRALDAPNFRILLNRGNLTLNRISLGRGFAIGGSGGGIVNTETGRLKLFYCEVAFNSAEEKEELNGVGGGIYNGGRLTVIKSTIYSNEASNAGGGIANTGELIFFSSTAHNNSAKTWGGAILSYSIVSGGRATVEAVNSTFSSNVAGEGGGALRIQSGAANLTHSTITVNVAPKGAGISNLSASVNIKNSIVGNNYYPVLPGIHDCDGELTSEGYNLISVNTCNFVSGVGDKVGSAINPVDPELEILAENDEGNGAPVTHSLTSASPAIDAVPLSECAKGDQRSFFRPMVIQSDRTPCDMGAHEQDAKPICLGVLTPFAATIVGTAADDILTGTDGLDVIHGLGGNDEIRGLGAGDFICGGTGDDTLDGDDGNDVLYGQDGDDIVNGGANSDILWGAGEVGTNELNGNGGNDLIVGGIGDDKMNGGNGNNDRCNGRSEINGDTETECEVVENVP